MWRERISTRTGQPRGEARQPAVVGAVRVDHVDALAQQPRREAQRLEPAAAPCACAAGRTECRPRRRAGRLRWRDAPRARPSGPARASIPARRRRAFPARPSPRDDSVWRIRHCLIKRSRLRCRFPPANGIEKRPAHRRLQAAQHRRRAHDHARAARAARDVSPGAHHRRGQCRHGGDAGAQSAHRRRARLRSAKRRERSGREIDFPARAAPAPLRPDHRLHRGRPHGVVLAALRRALPARRRPTTWSRFDPRRLIYNMRAPSSPPPHARGGAPFLSRWSRPGCSCARRTPGALCLVVPDDLRAWAREQLAPLRPARVVHVHPVSRWLWKCWDNASMAAVIDWLQAERGARVVVTTGPVERERDRAREIVALCRTQPLFFDGNLSLTQIAALSAASDGYFGVDTAPMHMAAAVGVPVVALFGPTNPESWGPWTPRGRVLSAPCPCNEANRHGVRLEPRCAPASPPSPWRRRRPRSTELLLASRHERAASASAGGRRCALGAFRASRRVTRRRSAHSRHPPQPHGRHDLHAAAAARVARAAFPARISPSPAMRRARPSRGPARRWTR